MRKGGKSLISGGIFRKITAAGIALVMMAAMMPGTGLANQACVSVTYYSNAPGNQSPVTDTVAKGSTYKVRNNCFTYSGFTFTGWNTQANGSGTSVAAGQTVTANASHMLYAQWKSNAVEKVTITYKANANDNQADVKDSVNKGSSYTARSNLFTRSGYVFTGWNTKADGSGTPITPGQTVVVNASYTLFAQWRIIAAETVSIVYIANTGNPSIDIIDVVNKGCNYTVRSNTFNRPNYIFTGWNTKADGSGTSVVPGQIVTVNASYTLYAQWRSIAAETVSIVYIANAAEAYYLDIIDVVNKGSNYTVRNNTFNRTGYTFYGWNTKPDGSGISVIPGQTLIVNSSYTLYAQWRANLVEIITIIYTANTGGNVADFRDSVNKGSVYTIRNIPFSHVGLVFYGWNTQANGYGTSYSIGQEIIAYTNLTLYAQWTAVPVEKVTITYVANAGNNQADIKDTVNKGSKYTLRGSNTFTRSGWTFVSWNTRADGYGGVYAAGEDIFANASLTLYAKWNQNTPSNPIVDVPTCVDGRILPPSKTGDNCDWIEIARNGNCSLIIRKNYIITHPTLNLLGLLGNILEWVISPFGSSNAYSSSNVRKYINDFFNCTSTGTADRLPLTANLRNFTLQHNALSVLGTSCYAASLTNGFSKPTANKLRTGNDVCFALSYSEAANFLSLGRFSHNSSPYIQSSSANACKNFYKLNAPNQSGRGIWLRSPGDNAKSASLLHCWGSSYYGVVYQEAFSYCTLTYPALWVDSAIFN